MQDSAEYWIEKLGLADHPEGGYFAPAYRSYERLRAEMLPCRFEGDRAVVSSIYYLLKRGQFSAIHRLKNFEIWSFYAGAPLSLYVFGPDGRLSERRLGRDVEKGEVFQATIEPGLWFGAAPMGEGEFTLAGCTVAPGFEYSDLEFACRKDLTEAYPEHRDLIERLTRS